MKCSVCILVLCSLALFVSAEEAHEAPEAPTPTQSPYCHLDDEHLTALTTCVGHGMTEALRTKLQAVTTSLSCANTVCTLRKLCEQEPLSTVSVFNDEEKHEFRTLAAGCHSPTTAHPEGAHHEA
ncbi:putative ricinusin [Ixodes scapularis]|uniref:Ricinusin, putative n=1 Tax=Ixodes scapularis TaxID=6945 RepID=B7QMQ5_IXOSC|nr:ricinusin, putative [Ixodes scapularis]|eukprot:XP_002400090.1 ricinusin, putative [Ixodes scapularis]